MSKWSLDLPEKEGYYWFWGNGWPLTAPAVVLVYHIYCYTQPDGVKFFNEDDDTSNMLSSYEGALWAPVGEPPEMKFKAAADFPKWRGTFGSSDE